MLLNGLVMCSVVNVANIDILCLSPWCSHSLSTSSVFAHAVKLSRFMQIRRRGILSNILFLFHSYTQKMQKTILNTWYQ